MSKGISKKIVVAVLIAMMLTMVLSSAVAAEPPQLTEQCRYLLQMKVDGQRVMKERLSEISYSTALFEKGLIGDTNYQAVCDANYHQYTAARIRVITAKLAMKAAGCR